MSITINLDSLTSHDLSCYFAGSPPVVIIGSGISAFEPTRLPTGQDFSAGVRDALFETPGHPPITVTDRRLLDKLLSDVPFEMIMERCPDQSAILKFISELYSVDDSNEIHNAIGELVRNGAIYSVITTNYDMGLDRALTGTSLVRVVSESDVPSCGSRLYFKIHGSADVPSTMVFSLTHESEMPSWKRSLLAKAIAGRPLLLIGYSGLDFEVCPELTRCMPTAILWNFFSESSLNRSPGFKHIERLVPPKIALIGDMRELFNLLGMSVNPCPARSGIHKIGNELRSRFGTELLLLWRVGVLSSIGHARLALESIEPFSPYSSMDSIILLEHAQALFHNGQYKSSANQWFHSARLSYDEHFRLHRELDACDALRCYGDFRNAWATVQNVIFKLSTSLYDDVAVRAILKEMLLTWNQFQIRKKLLLGLGCEKLRNRARGLIEQGAPEALRVGLWLDFQQFKLWAERFEFPDGTLSKHGGYEPLPTREGYRHLGYFIPILMDLYDRASDVRKTISKAEIEEGFEAAQDMGCHPVAWKLSRCALRRFPAEASYWHYRYRTHFKSCQYSWKLRLAYKMAWPL